MYVGRRELLLKKRSQITGNLAAFDDLGQAPAQTIQMGYTTVPVYGDPAITSRMVPNMVPNPAYAVWVAQQAAIPQASNWYQVAASGQQIPIGPLSTIQSYAQQNVNESSLYRAGSEGVANFPVYHFQTPDGLKFWYVPDSWSAGGGGIAKLDLATAQAHGGSQLTLAPPQNPAVQSNLSQTGFVFAYNPVNVIGPPGAGSKLTYTPGIGSDFANTMLTIAAVAALPFAAAAISAAAAAGGAGAAAGGAGAAAGAEGVVGPAEAALVSTGAGATGGGLTTAGVISAAQTGASIVSAASTAVKLAQMATSHASAADSLSQQAAAQSAAGNVAAAAALYQQAAQNQAYAQQYGQQAQVYAQQSGVQIPGLTGSISGVPIWALLGGGILLVLLLKRK